MSIRAYHTWNAEDVERPVAERTEHDSVVLPVLLEDTGEHDSVENMLGYAVSDGVYRLALTPGFVHGFAAGDLVRYDPARRSLELLERGLKVGVQLFYEDLTDRHLDHIEQQVRSVGGTVDGRLDGLRVLTFPATVRVKNVENFLKACESFPGVVEWEFANLFSADGHPLEWWKDYV